MRTLAAALLALVAAAIAAGPARAQEERQAQSYITPFPENDTYKMTVIGDWLAEGLLSGITESFGGDVRLQLLRKHRPLNGVSRAEFEDDLKTLDDGLGRDSVHIAVVFTGVGDRVSYRAPNGKRWTVGTDEWRAEYGRRLDRLMKVLKRRNIAAYIVGQPIQRKAEWNDDIQMMNEVMRERAYVNGLKFIDIFAGFADEAGSYAAHGPDLTGKIRVLRSGDGTGFTPDGNRKLAHFIERDIRRDLTQAKADRNIPLAGSEADQRKITPERTAAAAPPAVTPVAPAPGMASKAGKEAKAWASTVNPAAAPQVAGAGERADNSRIALRSIGAGGREEVTTLDILRPAIPATIIALVTRRESADKPSQLGDTVSDTIAGGTMVMSSITPTGATPGGRGRPRLGMTQTSFYRVMVKGERLPPRLGRADDFSWPRQEAVDLLPPAQPAAAPTPAEKKGPAAKSGAGARQPRS